MTTNPADILAVHALTLEPDEDDPNQTLVKGQDGSIIAAIYADDNAISVRCLGGLPVGMADLDQAYSWIVGQYLQVEQLKANQ